MARTGLYKSQVKTARDTLIAQGKHPSVDAIRIVLGNTGSKTTIHKYLKELEEESGGVVDRQSSLSEQIQNLISHLAAQLQDEAEETIGKVLAESAEKEQQNAQTLAAAHQEINQLTRELQHCQNQLSEEKLAIDILKAALQDETVIRSTLNQEVSDLKDRLAENEIHRQSLEAMHQHARDSLEHYRESVKEQREQDQRRYEQQIQQLQAELRQLQQTMIVKQDEITRLNQDKTRLISEVSYAQENLRLEQTTNRELAQKVVDLERAELQRKPLEGQIMAKDAHITDLMAQLEQQHAQTHSLELALAAAQAKLEVQQTNWKGLMQQMAETAKTSNQPKK